MKPDENIPLMTWRARPDMSCEQVSRAWLEYTGYTPQQALGEGWTRAIHPEDLGRWLDTCVQAFDERKPFEVEYRLRRRDGEYRWVLERAAPLYAGEGLFVGYAGACVDIDAHHRMQHGLARALERERRARIATEEASRLRHDLMVSVLEELRGPAEAVAACAARLEDRTIERHARAQCRVIANLLELARPGAAAANEPLLSGVRVLVAGMDGEGHALQSMLAVAGAEVRLASSTEDALGTVGSWQPDVLLSDLGKDGDSLIRELRALPAERGGCLRAAALSADDASTAGYDARLSKPVEPVALLATVARLAGP
ncbi:MAG TPA: PAS domain-containing protein [Burkholderiales bacterium]|nr:PAS domain-containing protein [Burkholderiales bacterium]